MDPNSNVKEEFATETTQSPTSWLPKPDDLVFAKVKGYSYWPARVLGDYSSDKLKTGPAKHRVFFFGTYETAVVNGKDIVPYKENRDKYGNGKKKKFAIAIKEIEETPFITGKPSKVDASDAPTKASVENEDSSLGANANGDADEFTNGINDGKDLQSSDAVEKSKAETSNVSNGKKGRGKRKAAQAAPVNEPKKKRGRKPKSEVKADAKTASNKKQNRGRKNDTNDSLENEDNINEETCQLKETDASPTLTESKPVVDPSDTSRIIQTSKLERLKAKAAEKEKLKEELKLAKLEKKRRERLEKLKSLPVTDSLLRDIESEIVESLSVEKTDIPRCLQAMSRLDLFQVTPTALCKYPQILSTIKLCRKYKSDENVRHKSVYLYNKFKLLFANGVDEALQKPDSNNSCHNSPEPAANPSPMTQPTLPDSTSDAKEASESNASNGTNDPIVSSTASSIAAPALVDSASTTASNVASVTGQSEISAC